VSLGLGRQGLGLGLESQCLGLESKDLGLVKTMQDHVNLCNCNIQASATSAVGYNFLVFFIELGQCFLVNLGSKGLNILCNHLNCFPVSSSLDRIKT